MQYKDWQLEDSLQLVGSTQESEKNKPLPIIAGLRDADSQVLRVDIPEVLMHKLRSA